MMQRRVFLGGMGAAAGLYGAAWNQWRGPERTGVAAAFQVPGQWPKALKKVWAERVGSGYSTPVVSETAVYVFERQGDQEVLRALERETGKGMWRAAYAAPFTENEYARSMGKGPFATPALVGDRVVTFGVNGVLSAYETTGGKLAWRKDYSGRVSNRGNFTGTASSPLVEGGMIVFPVGDDRGGAMRALDGQSGAEKWAWEGDGPSYSSPIAVTLGGKRQIVALMLKHAVGLDAQRGTLLWQVDFPDQWNENIVTPVAVGSRMIFSGTRRGTIAVDVAAVGGRWQAKVAWENAEYPMYMSSPVSDGPILYGVTSKRKGSLFAMDTRTGKVLWSTVGREGTNVSLAAAGGLLVTMNDTGDMKIVRRSPSRHEVVAEYKVAEEGTWAQPVLVGTRILVRDAGAVTMFDAKG